MANYDLRDRIAERNFNYGFGKGEALGKSGGALPRVPTGCPAHETGLRMGYGCGRRLSSKPLDLDPKSRI